MPKKLYHGTRYLGRILADGALRPGPYGDRHISLTTRLSVARYWAKMYRDDVLGHGYIVTLDGDQLKKDGYSLVTFKSSLAQFDEHEIACSTTIKPILRYILAIERVAQSELQMKDVARWKSGFRQKGGKHTNDER